MDLQIDQFDSTQREAVEACCDVDNRVVAVTGPAGTGKTSIMRAVYQLLTEAGYTVALCAPTGKAAKRIYEATGIRAVTIHALLEYTHPGDRNEETGQPEGDSYPKRDRRNPLQFDTILADEYMMVGQELHRNLFDALPRGGRVCVFGDENQLPPIEKIKRLAERPSPFQEILQNPKLKSIWLTTIHRQDEGSGIVSNGAMINAGRIPKRLSDFALVVTDRPTDKLRDLVKAARDNHGIDFSGIENQIITSSNRTWVGGDNLNQLLQTIFRPEPDGWFELPRHGWVKQHVYVRENDKVIITSNMYDLRQQNEKFEWDEEQEKWRFLKAEPIHQVFNGETGIVREITEFGELIIDLGDRVITVPPELEYKKAIGEDRYKTLYFDPRKNIDLAYAITTHKAQGSEYDYVVYVLNKSTAFMQSRRNFYTAVTRARKHVSVITDQRSLSHSVWKRQ